MSRVLQKAARVIVVLSLIAAFEIASPDRNNGLHLASAATAGTGSCAQTVGDAANVSVTTSGSYCVVTFTGSTTWTGPAGVTSVKLLVVGGGGGGGGGSRSNGDGGRGGGGGGGGGNTIYKTSYAVTGSTVYTVTVGAGGAGGAANNVDAGFGSAGSAGGNSSISGSGAVTTTASGGGGGTAETALDSSNAGGDGGSSSQTVDGTTTARSGGGNVWEGAGGGAGAGGNGANGSDIGGRGGNGGNGGTGYAIDITGASVTYAGGGGGGGTRGDDISNGTAGSGGSGGGGAGGILSTSPVAGTAALGGGGGGGGGWRDATYVATSGASGGSGVVIVSYVPPPSYTVTYDTNGGDAVSPVTWVSGTTLTLPTPTRTGYIFNGWGTSADASTLVYQTTNPIRSGNNIVYSAGYGKGGSDAAATLTAQGATFTRVRYRMQANYSGVLRYADVSFDKWAGATIANLAVPDLADTRTIKTNVTNLTIDSNWPGFAGTASAVTTGTGKSGRIELWPWNYSQGVTGVATPGNGSIYDSDDTPAYSAAYGSFQVHNLTDSQTVLAWNNHSNANPDIGFGNNLGSVNTDWTFMGSTNFDRATWKMQIFIGDLMAGGYTYTPSNSSNFTLYAQWTPNLFDVTYNTQGGSAIATGSTMEGASIASSPGTPTRGTDTFKGWYTASTGGSLVTFPYVHGRSSAFTLWAQWVTNQAALTVSGSSSGTYGGTVSLTASGGSSTGAVSWSNGASTACTVNSSGVVSITSGTGTCAITATKAGDADYNSVSSSAFAITVGKAAQSALSVTSTAVDYNDTLTLTHTGGSGTGAVTWSKVSGTCTVSGTTLNPGDAGSACVVKVTKATDSNYSARSSADTTITVNKISQTGFNTSASATTFNAGSTVSVSALGGQSTGSVSWSVNSGTCTISGSTVSSSRGGITCVLEATRAGDTNYNPVSDTLTLTVRKVTQTLTFRTTAPSPSTVGSSYAPVVDSDAFLAPTITVANASAAVCSVTAGVVTFNGVGSCLISASQAGNDMYSSASASQTVTVVLPAAIVPTTVASASGDGGGAATPTTIQPFIEGATTTTAPAAVTPTKAADKSATAATTTTSTTTTTLPAARSGGGSGSTVGATELKAGETTALVRGKVVKAKVEHVKDSVVMTLPNDVKIVIGKATPSSKSAAVAADGILRVYHSDTADVVVTGLTPGSVYTVVMFSTPIELARGVADGNGEVRATVNIPQTAEFGEHTLQMNGVGPEGEMLTTSLGIEVLDRKSNTGITVVALTLAILLALLGGRPILVGRRRRRTAE